MKKILYSVGILFVCSLHQSCSIQSMMSLQPYNSKIQTKEEYPISEQGKVKIISNISYYYNDLYEWKEPDSDKSCGYTIYEIDVRQERQSDNNTEFTIELISINVTECGNPLQFSIFQKTYPGKKNPELIVTPYVVKDCNTHKFFIKIQKPVEEIRQISIKYNFEINGIPVIKEHIYRTQFSVETKHHTLFKCWVSNCSL